MLLHNIRLGHACNSSSTHSIVPLTALMEKRGVTSISDSDGGGWGEHSFGWEKFTAASREERALYLYLQLKDRVDATLVTELTGLTAEAVDSDAYIDHQSIWDLPSAGPMQEEFLRDLTAYFLDGDVVVLGGDDNGDDPEMEGGWVWGHADLRAGVGPDGKRYWTAMNRTNGDKLRFTFEQPLRGDDLPELPELPYGSVPELIDMKITGKCPFFRDACGTACYMASDMDGEHAPTGEILAYLDRIAAAGAFEVALGGGEPTLHPDFAVILRHGQRLGLSMNWTTKNYALFEQARLTELLPLTNAVACSVNDTQDFTRFKKAHAALEDAHRIKSEWEIVSPDTIEITLQTIPAFCPKDLLAEMIAWCLDNDVRITLLGFKRVGRGTDRDVARNERWMDTLTDIVAGDGKNGNRKWGLERIVAIDTLMAAACEDTFREAGISPQWWTTQEGAFSAYIDAVTGQLGESSYVPAGQMQPYASNEPLGPAFVAMQLTQGIRSETAVT